RHQRPPAPAASGLSPAARHPRCTAARADSPGKAAGRTCVAGLPGEPFGRRQRAVRVSPPRRAVSGLPGPAHARRGGHAARFPPPPPPTQSARKTRSSMTSVFRAAGPGETNRAGVAEGGGGFGFYTLVRPALRATRRSGAPPTRPSCHRTEVLPARALRLRSRSLTPPPRPTTHYATQRPRRATRPPHALLRVPVRRAPDAQPLRTPPPAPMYTKPDGP
ncbi:hypothetical protein LCGC14_1389660, partial [marine sediment metagenome]